ncbi:5'-3' exonuclease [Romboutsia weinsteinii]|nr:5'-3' exonuclease H3TH domain-containing protein [Romboutsia weinsteinii]
MDNLFDLLEYEINKDVQKKETNNMIKENNDSYCNESHLLHLKKLEKGLYNEDDIISSGLIKGDYIRVNSYIGSRLNTDLRGINRELKKDSVIKAELKLGFEEVEFNADIFDEEVKCIADKLLIVDGSSLLSTSFYATARDLLFAKTDEQKEFAYTKLMQTPDGIYTNGIYMFFKTLLPLLERQRITHLAVVLDRSRSGTFRRELDPEYKANRKETPIPLSNQFKLLTEILPQLNIPIFSHEYYEADDFAGSLVKKFETDIETILHTKDEDYIQLVSDNTKLWIVTGKRDAMYEELGINKKELNLPSGVFEYTPEYVKHFKGIEPIQIIDAKAIEGDKSDNIRGVKNVGETSSRPLLRHYTSLEAIYEAIDNLDIKSEKEISLFFKEQLGIKRSPIKNLLLYKEDAFLSKKLATIKTDIDEIQDLELEKLKLDIDYETMNNIFSKLEMNSLIKKKK